MLLHRAYQAIDGRNVLDMNKTVARVSDSSHSCAALRQTPSARIEQPTFSPPDAVGQHFALDVIKCLRQLMLVHFYSSPKG